MKNYDAIALEKRAKEIIKPWTEAPSMSTTGYFGVTDNNTRNLLKSTDMTLEKAIRAIMSDAIIASEVNNTEGLKEALMEEVQKAMQPSEFIPSTQHSHGLR